MAVKKVYVIQKQMVWDDIRGDMVPKYDMSGAEQYGQLVYLLSPHARIRDDISDELSRKLETFNDDDHLLLVGNPALIGLATAVACRANSGRVKFLQWDSRSKTYDSVQAEIS